MTATCFSCSLFDKKSNATSKYVGQNVYLAHNFYLNKSQELRYPYALSETFLEAGRIVEITAFKNGQLTFQTISEKPLIVKMRIEKFDDPRKARGIFDKHFSLLNPLPRYKRYGAEALKVALSGKVRKGMNHELVFVAWGVPAEINGRMTYGLTRNELPLSTIWKYKGKNKNMKIVEFSKITRSVLEIN